MPSEDVEDKYKITKAAEESKRDLYGYIVEPIGLYKLPSVKELRRIDKLLEHPRISVSTRVYMGLRSLLKKLF